MAGSRFGSTHLELEVVVRLALPIALMAFAWPAVTAEAVAPPPITPKPTALTLSKTAKNVIATVTVKNLTSSNKSLIGLDVRATSPTKHFAVHQNGPNLPYTVNPIPAKFDGQSTGRATVKKSGKTLTFTFARKAIGSPRSAKIYAFQAGEGGNIGAHTRFVTIHF
jgi:hypothetical protein